MYDLFYKDNYDQFLVVTLADSIDTPIFALPLSREDVFSEVFAKYVEWYVPEDATITMHVQDMDDILNRGRPVAIIQSGEHIFRISSIIVTKLLWEKVIPLWENQWVFDHYAHIGVELPSKTKRYINAGGEIKDEIDSNFRNRLTAALTVVFLVYAYFTLTRDDD